MTDKKPMNGLTLPNNVTWVRTVSANTMKTATLSLHGMKSLGVWPVKSGCVWIFLSLIHSASVMLSIQMPTLLSRQSTEIRSTLKHRWNCTLSNPQAHCVGWAAAEKKHGRLNWLISGQICGWMHGFGDGQWTWPSRSTSPDTKGIGANVIPITSSHLTFTIRGLLLSLCGLIRSPLACLCVYHSTSECLCALSTLFPSSLTVTGLEKN